MIAGRPEPAIHAAGGVVWRLTESGVLEVIVVHRPAFDDWSFPKGKLDPDDPDHEHAALREVLEETGYRCALGRELHAIEYTDRKGRHKRVRYWEMRPIGPSVFVPNAEVDQVAWLPLPAASSRLSYDTDKGVLDVFAAFAGVARPRG